MLCALKWLGLLCKSRLAKLVLLLTGRVVLLADVALAYLDHVPQQPCILQSKLLGTNVASLPAGHALCR